MTIKANLGLSVVNVPATTDTLVIDYSALAVDRYSIVSIVAADTSGASNTVSFYFSPNASIASGDLVSNITLSANTSAVVSDLQAQASSSQNLVVNATGALNIKVTVTTYDGV